MPNKIHASAIISDEVILGVNNEIGPFVVLQGKIIIGNNNKIGVGTNICNNVIIGDNNDITAFVSIGEKGEMGQKGDVFLAEGSVVIGNHNTFREYSTIQSPVRSLKTIIGNNSYFMARTHIPHDAIIGDHVTMATNSLIGGGCEVGDYAYIGLGAMTHQRLKIGESAMIGMQACITKSVLPFTTVIGNPARILGFNIEGIRRRNMDLSNLDTEIFKEILKNQASPYNCFIHDSILKFMFDNTKSINLFFK
jgi:UDP-N-acetylglucosamine acyltransferase